MPPIFSKSKVCFSEVETLSSDQWFCMSTIVKSIHTCIEYMYIAKVPVNNETSHNKSQKTKSTLTGRTIETKHVPEVEAWLPL